MNSGRVTGSGPGALKRAVRKKLAQKGWPGGSSRPQGAAVFKEGRVRIEQKAGDGSMMASRSEEITDLIYVFCKSQYRAKEVTPSVDRIEKRCLELFDRDYKYSIIHNTNGDVCGHYPRKIVFLEYECSDNNKESFESTVQISKLQDLVNRSKMARCRGRFVCPVILYNGKHVCRSSTLAGWGELYGRTGYNYIFSGGSDDTFGDAEEVLEDDCAVRNNDSQLFDKVRGSDIKLLKYLSIRYICDLMVENKKVKFGLNVTSSEKVDKAQRYADFTLLSVPYPGCEFFREYKDRDYTAEGLVFNWNQGYVDAPLTIPACFTKNLNINWSEYQSWDLVQQTQNYLKLLLHIINSDESRDRGSVTSLSSDFSLITEDTSAPSSLHAEATDLITAGPQASNGCTFVPDRQVRLEAVRELFLAAYSSTVGLKSSAPSPSGAISGLLEQFARGVGLRGTNAII
ncbi:myotubularin-related 14-like isoform X1 [Labeo rohita]|uniref:Myotubularin-related 14-like isoform X1 n=1 Tax=Labeo rohita TaxID=84645 RepID=A0A498MT34_LABRO|nr:myotubularin-related 14-like isoform X1 [Labeo rohita]